MQRVIHYLCHHSFDSSDPDHVAFLSEKIGVDPAELFRLLSAAIGNGFVEPESDSNWLISTQRGRAYAGIDEDALYEGYLITLIREIARKEFIGMHGLTAGPEMRMVSDVIRLGLKRGLIEGVLSVSETGRRYAGIGTQQ